MIHHELCRLAIRQAHLLHRLLPAAPEVDGLLALQLLSYARTLMRATPDRTLVPLDQQDRRVWDREAINEGLALLDRTLRRGRHGQYQIQAAISATHRHARRWEDTDWAEIVRLYDALLAITPSAIIRLNRALAVSRLHGARTRLDLVNALREEKGLPDRHAFHAVRGGLLEEVGRHREARAAFELARARTTNTDEARYFQSKIDGLGDEDVTAPRRYSDSARTTI